MRNALLFPGAKQVAILRILECVGQNSQETRIFLEA